MPPVSLLATLLATVLSFVLGGLRGMSLVRQDRPLRRRGRKVAVLGQLSPVPFKVLRIIKMARFSPRPGCG